LQVIGAVRKLLSFAGMGLVVLSAKAQRAGESPFDPRTTLAAAVTFTTGSRDLIAGFVTGRKILALSGDYDVRLHEGRRTEYRWEFEVLPLAFVSDPREVSDETSYPNGQPPTYYRYDALIATPCVSGSDSGTYYTNNNGVGVEAGTFSSTTKCSTAWTYSGGVSPLGQRISFQPRKRLQPYLIVNAGFLASTRAVPLSDAAEFNFTAEGGAGVEIFESAKRSLTFDVRYHHLSNGGRGDENPGVENVMFKVSYRVGR